MASVGLGQHAEGRRPVWCLCDDATGVGQRLDDRPANQQLVFHDEHTQMRVAARIPINTSHFQYLFRVEPVPPGGASTSAQSLARAPCEPVGYDADSSDRQTIGGVPAGVAELPGDVGVACQGRCRGLKVFDKARPRCREGHDPQIERTIGIRVDFARDRRGSVGEDPAEHAR